MPLRTLAVVASFFIVAPLFAADPPVSADPRLVVELFAAAPDIVHPIAMDFDTKGRLLVVESHTHFRPAKYDGPKADRVRMFEDTDNDGKIDRISTFFEGTVATMDLAVHFDGSVYLATRNEVIRLRDTDGDGKADERKRIAFLETAGNYPHNGLSGITFDSKGNLTFGMGENLGASYKLIGSDGTTISSGEGGRMFWCMADGSGLRQVASGFWNPFGAGRDIFGRLFVVDNDPDASPPCRMLQIVEGGDYGYQFRYGRAGRHPFQAWNGELPGTLPQVAGTGESPCEVISYESDGLPGDYRGHLLVPAWADHRVERYVPRANGAGTVADRKPFIQGGKDFRPSGLAVAPDGSLFVSDWVLRSYELHKKGAIWHIREPNTQPIRRDDPKQAIAIGHRPTREAAARKLAADASGREFLRGQLNARDVRVRAASLTALIDANDDKIDLSAIVRTDKEVGMREMAVRALVARGSDVAGFTDDKLPASVRAEAVAGSRDGSLLLKLLADPDPYLRHAATMRLAKLPDVLAGVDARKLTEAKQRIGVLLARRASAKPEPAKTLAVFLNDPDPDVRLLAVKWVADDRLAEFRSQIADALKSPTLDPRGVVALTTALARIDDKPVNEDGLATYFLDRLTDKSAPASTRLMALKAIPAAHGKLRTELLTELLKQAEPAFRIEVLRTLKDRADPKTSALIRGIAQDAGQPAAVRAQAVVAMAALAQIDVDAMIELAGSPERIVQQEALRSLTQATPEQRSKLKGKLDDELFARALGKPFFKNRPAATDTEAWLKFLDGPADPEAGRRVFEHSKLTGCYRCHRVDGRGANVGPDLSLIGRTERRWIVESILQPSSVVAPHYQAWKIDTVDGRTLTGLLVHTQLDESYYVDAKGERFKVSANDVQETSAARGSIMPDKLVDALTDQEIRDLVAYLASRK